MKTLVAAALVAGAFATVPVVALEVGTLQLHRPAGQPAYAEILLTDSMPIDPGSIRARLATPEGYRVAGMRYTPALRGITLTPQQAADGRVVLRVDGLPGAGEAGELDLLVLVGNRMSLSLKEYRVDLRGLSREFAPATAGTRLAAAKPGAQAPSTGRSAAAAAPPSAQPAEPAPASLDEASRKQVEQALDAWAKAWSDRNVEAYLASYLPDYQPPGGRMSHADWEKQRRQRVGSKRSIEVALSAVQLRERGDAVVASFQQRYRGDDLVENSRKRITFVRRDGRWLIQEEVELR